MFLFSSPILGGESRGIRTNNPGNLVKTNIQWKGEIVCEDKVNECFTHHKYGIRAMVKTLKQYYYRDQIRSIAGFVNQYGPRGQEYSKQRQDYTSFLMKRVSVVCGESYRSFLYKLVPAIIHFENGKQPYKEKEIRQIIDETISPIHTIERCEETGSDTNEEINPNKAKENKKPKKEINRLPYANRETIWIHYKL